MTIKDVRKKIDQIDQDIVNLLGKRSRLVKEIGGFKENKRKIKDIRREQQVLRRLKQQAAKEDLDPIFIEKIYKDLFDYFVQYQRDMIKNPDK